MFINGRTLLNARPIRHMFVGKMYHGDTSFGLSEAGYDIRIQEEIFFKPGVNHPTVSSYKADTREHIRSNPGRFILACSMEEFNMPHHLVGTVRDKSSWARRGVSVFNTIIEPGWRGFLTLELVFSGNQTVTIPAGSGIAQVLFGQLSDDGDYGNGKYQDAPGLEEAK